MISFFSNLLQWVYGGIFKLFGVLFSINFLKFKAWKLVISAGVTYGVFIVVNNLIVHFVTKILNETSQFFSDGTMSSATIQLTGLAAYFAQSLFLPECLSLIITGVVIRAIRQTMPF